MHLHPQPSLVFRTVLHGTARVAWRCRRARLDEDGWLVLDGRERCDVLLDPHRRTRLLQVSVSAQELATALAGARPEGAGGVEPFVFTDSLRPRDGPVGRRLLAIAALREARRGPEVERIERIALVRDALIEEEALRRRAARIDCVKLATREQLLRRILMAADFITSQHDEPITLGQMARAASLSRFHFVRLFSLVLDETPHAFLRRKRTAVARRHLAEGGDCAEAACRAGFGSRSALFRNLRKAPAIVGDPVCSRSA